MKREVINNMKPKSIVLIGMMASLLFVVQVSLSFIPNVELVSLLIILYTKLFHKKTIFIIYVFVLLEGLMYGFGIWWFGYLYVWIILYIIITKLNHASLYTYAIVSSAFGLSFGALFSIPYFLIGRFSFGISFWISGIPFDITHSISNFILILILYKPLFFVLDKLNKQYELI